MSRDARIILLHHSTGNCIWKGGVPEWFEKYNAENGTQYRIEERAFPQKEPYGWKNYPYDYWNIWVKNAGDEPDDNIYVWDFFALETEGGPFLLDEYASGPGNSHPGEAFNRKCAPLFARRIVDVIEGRGDAGSLTGL